MLWGCSKNNVRGEIIENFIEANDLCLMNDKSYTYLHPATGTINPILIFILLREHFPH